MAEPIFATGSTAAASVGIMALLIGAFGPVAADVMLVVISALAGCFIALSGMQTQTILRSIGFVIIGVSTSLILSWGITNLVTSYVPFMSGPYTPSIIAMFIGFLSNRMPMILNLIIQRIAAKFGIDEQGVKQ